MEIVIVLCCRLGLINTLMGERSVTQRWEVNNLIKIQFLLTMPVCAFEYNGSEIKESHNLEDSVLKCE